MVGAVQTYEDLRVWQDAVTLAEMTYDLCKQLPKEERYGLSMQMRRSAVSIASNIAEGSERNSTKELVQFLRIARGSHAELRTQIVISKRVYAIAVPDSYESIDRRLSKSLAALIKSLIKP